MLTLLARRLCRLFRFLMPNDIPTLQDYFQSGWRSLEKVPDALRGAADCAERNHLPYPPSRLRVVCVKFMKEKAGLQHEYLLAFVTLDGTSWDDAPVGVIQCERNVDRSKDGNKAHSAQILSGSPAKVLPSVFARPPPAAVPPAAATLPTAPPLASAPLASTPLASTPPPAGPLTSAPSAGTPPTSNTRWVTRNPAAYRFRFYDPDDPILRQCLQDYNYFTIHYTPATSIAPRGTTPTATPRPVRSRTDPTPLTLVDLVAAAIVLHERHPCYELLRYQCYWFAGMLYYMLGGSTEQKVQVSVKKGYGQPSDAGVDVDVEYGTFRRLFNFITHDDVAAIYDKGKLGEEFANKVRAMEVFTRETTAEKLRADKERLEKEKAELEAAAQAERERFLERIAELERLVGLQGQAAVQAGPSSVPQA